MNILNALTFILLLGSIEKKPVTISEVSLVKEPSLYLETTVTGPFFEADKWDRLTIRTIPDPNEIGPRWWEVYLDPERVSDGGPLRPGHYEAAFENTGGVMEFYRDGTLVQDGEPAPYMNEFMGTCLDSNSGRLKILFDQWTGGATTPGSDEVYSFDPQSGKILGRTYEWIEGSGRDDHIDCAEDETTGSFGESFHPCSCAGKIDGEDYFSATSKIRNARTIQNPISEADFSSLLARISDTRPIFERFDDISLEIQRFESAKFEVVTIIYEESRLYADCQFVFVRRVGGSEWVRVHDAPGTSKGFPKATIHGFVDDDVLDITMAPEWSYWPKLKRVKKNLGDWMLNPDTD